MPTKVSSASTPFFLRGESRIDRKRSEKTLKQYHANEQKRSWVDRPENSFVMPFFPLSRLSILPFYIQLLLVNIRRHEAKCLWQKNHDRLSHKIITGHFQSKNKNKFEENSKSLLVSHCSQAPMPNEKQNNDVGYDIWTKDDIIMLPPFSFNFVASAATLHFFSSS